MAEITQVTQALNTMYSNADQESKKLAMDFLENFQKSKESWEICNKYLDSDDDSVSSIQVKLFLCQTLRNKLTYDMEQISDNNLGELRSMILKLLVKYSNNKAFKLIRIQLNVCICQIILQDVDWANPLADIIEFFVNNKFIENLFEFLKILPEEINDVNKTYLTDDEFNNRVNLIMSEANIEQIFILFNNFVSNENLLLILDCLINWIRELPIENFLKINELTNLIFNSISNEELFEKAIDCLIVIIRETRDIENLPIINALLNKLIELHQNIVIDEENFEILGKLYIESCECWHVLIAKNPVEFIPLVQILLKFLNNDDDLNIISYSFNFWYLLKQLLTIPNFKESRIQYIPIYEDLIRIILQKLTYPDDENFEGDKEQEDKFKDFRYDLGDVLKDATVIVGPTKALSIPFERIKAVVQSSNSTNDVQQFKWQLLESSLFSMRSMAKEIPKRENTILPQIMNFLISLPEHPKIRYSATLVLGRYTEWTNQNPEYLEMQLNYIIKGFNKDILANFNEKDYNMILISSTNALMYFCQDCSRLLINYLEQLYMLYKEINDKIDFESHLELIDGIAYILKIFEENDPKLYDTVLSFLDPVLSRLNQKFEQPNVNEVKLGEDFELLSAFFKILKIKNYDNYDNKVVQVFIQIVLPIMKKFLTKYSNNLLINEKIMKLVKVSLEAFNIYLLDKLEEIMNLLVEGFKANYFGCYLYVSGTVLKVFGDEEAFEPQLINIVFKFGIEQCNNFFKLLNMVDDVNKIPDIIEDFFRMLDDLLMYYPNQFFEIDDDNVILNSSVESSLILIEKLLNFESIISICHYLIDLVSFGSSNFPISFIEIKDENLIRFKVLNLINSKGEIIIKKLINFLIFKFNDVNNDTILYEINELILKFIVLSPENHILNWLLNILKELPNNDIKQLNKFNSIMSTALQNKDQKRIRSGLKDYINWYTRKNVKRSIT